MIMNQVKEVLRPVVRGIRRRGTERRYREEVRLLQKEFGNRVAPRGLVQADAGAEDIRAALADFWPGRIVEVPLPGKFSGARYWQEFGGLYSGLGNGREKALEHSLSLDLLDFSSVRRHCDVAASVSPFAGAMAKAWPGLEYWRQDCEYQTDWAAKVLGGFAQELRDVPGGFFDTLTLHCSFEHFHGDADSLFVGEVDRILSERGACLILPLYLDTAPKIFFDPLYVSRAEITGYDGEALLAPALEYRQKHGRYYSPQTLAARVAAKLPPGLRATLLDFRGQESVDSGIYLRFGLVLHRERSVFRL